MDTAKTNLKTTLEIVYERLNRRELIPPDPLEFLYTYDAPDERDVVGFIAWVL